MQRRILAALADADDWVAVADIVGTKRHPESGNVYRDGSDMESARRAAHKLAAEGVVEVATMYPLVDYRCDADEPGAWPSERVVRLGGRAGQVVTDWYVTRRGWWHRAGHQQLHVRLAEQSAPSTSAQPEHA